jgi:hypothetical protein
MSVISACHSVGSESANSSQQNVNRALITAHHSRFRIYMLQQVIALFEERVYFQSLLK